MMNQTNYKPGKKSRNTMPGLTVPDMSLSIRDLLNRHKAGGRVKVYEPVYVGEESIIPPEFERMDKFQRAELAKQVADFVATTRGNIVSARQAAKMAQQEAEIIARYEAKRSRENAIVEDLFRPEFEEKPKVKK